MSCPFSSINAEKRKEAAAEDPRKIIIVKRVNACLLHETRYPITPATLAGVKSEREDRSTRIGTRCLVGASGLDVSRLLKMCQQSNLKQSRSGVTYLAAVADALVGGLLGAVTADVTDLTTVVALLTLGAVTRHVSETATNSLLADIQYRDQCANIPGVASLTALLALTTVATTVATLLLAVSATLVAVPGNVADLAALVAAREDQHLSW